MTDLPSRLKRLIEFNIKHAEMIAKEQRTRTLLSRAHNDGRSLADRIKRACFFSAQEENARLKPLLEKLIEFVYKVDDFAQHHYPSQQILTALAALEDVVKKMEEK